MVKWECITDDHNLDGYFQLCVTKILNIENGNGSFMAYGTKLIKMSYWV